MWAFHHRNTTISHKILSSALVTTSTQLPTLNPRAPMAGKACTKHFPVLPCTTKLAQRTFQYYFVLQNLHNEPTSTTLCYNACLHKALPSTTVYYKACIKHFPVRLCTTNPVLLCTAKLAQNTFQYYFVLQNLHKAPPSTTLCYNACLHKALPSTTVYYKACTKHFPVRPCTTNPVLLCTTKLAQNTFQYYFVLQSLQEVVPSTALYYKACRKHVPVRLCTTKLAQSTSQYDSVLQSLHKARSSTTLYYKSCTKLFPVRLCATKLAQSTTKLAQSTFQYYFVLQNLHKAPPSTTLCYNACLHKALPSTSVYREDNIA